ncbi:MAG: BNR-4 repeat-containing protein [Planctomycetes bacterium]|nr:BNR-4 repeat-containing protein [Planctomycetota bacterium]
MNANNSPRPFLVVLAVTSAVSCVMPALAQSSVGEIISTVGSERATTGNNNKIVTHNGKTHVVWQDSTPKGYFNRVRTLDHRSGQWSEPVELNKARDNHARPSITIDSRSFLHVILSGHSSSITWRRSLRPNDSSQWAPAEEAGAGTYPAVVCGPDDTLLATARAAGWRGVELMTRSPDGNWAQRRLVDRGDGWKGYSTFTSGLAVGPDGTIHLACNIARGKAGRPGLYQSVGYLRSHDAGRTWQKADGTKTPVPVLPQDMDLLVEANLPPRKLKDRKPEFPEVVANGNIVTDSEGRPYVLYISHLEKPGQLILATPDERGKWNQRTILDAERAYPDMRPIGSCFPVTITADNALHILLELVPFDDGWENGKPTRLMVLRSDPVKRLVRLVSTDRGKTFSVKSLIEPGTMFNMVNIERPTGINRIPPERSPAWVYFDGSPNYPGSVKVRNNNVFFVQRR